MGEENNYINGYVRDLNNHPISFDTEGNLVDQITGEKETMMLPEIKGDSIYDRTSHKYILNKLNNKRLYDKRKLFIYQ